MKSLGFMKMGIKAKIITAVLLAAVVVLICLAVSLMRDMLWTDTDEDILIDIPRGAGLGQIADLLEENEVIGYKTAFRVYEKLGRGRVYQSGPHTFKKGMSYGEVLDTLEKPGENFVVVTIPEGYELHQIAQLIKEKGLVDEDAFYEAVGSGDFSEYPYIAEIPRSENRLEGYLFPDTYTFERGQTAEQIIRMMLDNFNNKVYSAYRDSGTDKSLDEIVIMASIIEREAANDEERGKVASVFYNRLKIGMKLQSCATVQYIIKERKKVLSNKDTSIDSPYNTYMYAGLPAGPIASPGLSSVMAAINPEETDYYYFAAAADESHNVFSRTYEEHLNAAKEL